MRLPYNFIWRASPLNQTAPFEVADILAGGALDHFDGELKQTNFPSFVYSLNNRAVGVTGILDRTPCPIDDRLQGSAHRFFLDARLAKLKSVAQDRDLTCLIAQTVDILLRFFAEPFQHHSAKIFRAENFRALRFDPPGANPDPIDPVHQLRDEMKLKAGVAKGSDLALRRENNLRILNRVFDVVLFQMSG